MVLRFDTLLAELVHLCPVLRGSHLEVSAMITPQRIVFGRFAMWPDSAGVQERVGKTLRQG